MKSKGLIFASIALFFTCLNLNAQDRDVKIEGELKKWHKLTLSFESGIVSENDLYNPFLDYRLNVTFKNKDTEYIVPGFFAADGNAAETGAKKGKIWKVRFRPNITGVWEYEVSFRKGKNIAVNDSLSAGVGVFFDGIQGKIAVIESDKPESDFRSKGRLQYVGDRYLRFADSKEAFLKGGADSPESFLGYYEFDDTPPSHRYEAHREDWKKGDPVWQKDKGKNIIGALNYLASKGMNAVYFLTMNVQGDGKDVWPWINEYEQTRFDCSKLDQWEIVFDHMDELGMMLHIVTQETENELLLDIGQLGVMRKLYYRELIARFAHHLAITWNLGEENGPVHWSPKGQDDQDRKAMAKYIKENDPYKNFVALHTHSVPSQQDEVLIPLLGYEFLDGPSVQIHEPDLVHDTTKKWIQESQKSDRNWVVCLDEFGPADVGAKPDADDPDHDEIRESVLWGNLMAGGAGVEWYFGYKFAHMDLNCEDWRSRDRLWDQTKIALDFFNDHLPYDQMHSADGLTPNENDFVFVKNGQIYAIYLPKVVETQIALIGPNTHYSVRWFNPRTGGKLVKGTLENVMGGDLVSIGMPPNQQKDWVALVQNTKPAQMDSLTDNSEVITLDALTDFELVTSKEEASYYRDESNGVLAIDAKNKSQRNEFAQARALFMGKTGLYGGYFVTTAENDGESEYLVKLNGSIIDTITNPQVTESLMTIRNKMNKVYLYKGDMIQIYSKAVTNGNIPENGETAWSRGRWNALILIPDDLSVTDVLKDTPPLEEKEGFIEVEAEAFHYKTNNGTKRDWYIRSKNEPLHLDVKNIEDHTGSASRGAYIEALPDTRITHDDALLHGENFFPIAGVGGIVSYKIKINTPGKYYVWAKAFSSGSEDNGVHVGVDGDWPESAARMQWCENKNQWTWSSAQRRPENHCGTPKTIFLNFKDKGEYVVSFSMREDGFEMDKWIMVKDGNYVPE